MTAGREAERLRRLRALFARAQADGVSMAEARMRLLDERLARRAQAEASAAQLCGTAAPAFAQDDDDDNQGRYWWQNY